MAEQDGGPLRIVIADDNYLVREGTRRLLEDSGEVTVQAAVGSAELIDELPARLDVLPRQARLVLRMRYLQELSQQEIAEALEIPIGTVKSRINYGLSILRRTMNGKA